MATRRSRSQKHFVIERIFDRLWDEAQGRLTRTMVTAIDVQEAIGWCVERHGVTLSDRNPANFIKDIIRGPGANDMWPEKLKTLRWSAVQVTGRGNVFEFVPYREGQTVPFVTRFGYHDGVARHRVQSLSIPVASKALGRDDETYLIQVAVKLAVVETHFALESPIAVEELNHLQIGIKLRLCEVDSLFAATYKEPDGTSHRLVITCEAKKKGQRILEEQVVQQVRAAFDETDVDIVVPIAMQAAQGGIYIAEFRAVRRGALAEFSELSLEREALYELTPRIRGI